MTAHGKPTCLECQAISTRTCGKAFFRAGHSDCYWCSRAVKWNKLQFKSCPPPSTFNFWMVFKTRHFLLHRLQILISFRKLHPRAGPMFVGTCSHYLTHHIPKVAHVLRREDFLQIIVQTAVVHNIARGVCLNEVSLSLLQVTCDILLCL